MKIVGINFGFAVSPKVVLKVKENNYLKSSEHDSYSFNTPNGEALLIFPAPICGNMRDDAPSNTPLPACSITHFDKIPVRCCQSIILQHYVSCRIGIDYSKSRNDLISIVIKLILLRKKFLQHDKVPLQIDAWSLQRVIWPDNIHHWERKDYYKMLHTRAFTISDDLINIFFPLGNENIEIELKNC